MNMVRVNESFENVIFVVLNHLKFIYQSSIKSFNFLFKPCFLIDKTEKNKMSVQKSFKITI